MRGGMSEKDIVRQLKAEGYAFNEIEKALMAVVKAGAAPLPQGAELGVPPGPAQMPKPRPAPQPAPAPVEEMRPAPRPVYAPQPYETYQPAPPYPSYQEYAPAEEELQPEVIMEELIESVAEEKFDKFSANVKRLQDEIDKLNTDIAVVREKAETKPPAEVPKEISDRLDDIDVRLGGLEKAFRQLLPSINENVQAISKMVAERRRQQFSAQ